MIDLGVRAHDLGKFNTISELAERVAAHGFSCVQLALSKSLTGFTRDPSFFNPSFAAATGKTLALHGVRFAVLGCYINPVHPDPAERERQLVLFEDHLALARDFGAPIVATETGSRNPDCSCNPETFSE